MLHFMYLWLPFLLDLVIMLVLSGMRVERANEKLRLEQSQARQKTALSDGSEGGSGGED